MATELIKNIKAAEKKAEEIVKSAEAKAVKSIEEANQKHRKVLNDALKERANLLKKMLSDAGEEAAKEIGTLKKRYADEKKSFQEQARKSLDKAGAFVVTKGLEL